MSLIEGQLLPFCDALSSEIMTAAGDLASRIEHGEFDDLDEVQMEDLRGLSAMMCHWATMARVMESRLVLTRNSYPVLVATTPNALCN
jgi:hypothetical protein